MTHQEVGLSDQEYAQIVRMMGRAPNDVELGLFGVMWSEHCSYKSSKPLLTHLPTAGAHVVVGPGANAGVVRLDERLEVAFKIESHNHPSYVEPVQGAATGVGGIIRDIVAMGARPIALADCLRFGVNSDSQRLLAGVAYGIGSYGNAIGIPTVTGQLEFGPGYAKNPLVNVLAVGIREPHHAIGADSARPGSWLMLIGQKTGRDGIHGASLLASQDFQDHDQDLRPTVQVGDPFLGKLVMEATLETVAAGLVQAVQDLGAAGLTSAVSELCYRSGVGATLWLDRVPLRDQGMTAYEILLSETQERMLLVVAPEHLAAVQAIVDRWDVPWAMVGQVDESQWLSVFDRGRAVAQVAPEWLVHEVPVKAIAPELWPAAAAAVASSSGGSVPVALSWEMVQKVLAHPDCRDRWPVYRQYDFLIQTRTVWGPDRDLAILALHDRDWGLAIAVDGLGRWAAHDPYAAGYGAVSRALARLVGQDCEPLGLTDGINAGNPDRHDVYQGLAALVRGIHDAALAWQVPVTGGNVSLHNETNQRPIWPTAIVGAVGRHACPRTPYPDAMDQVGDEVWVVNPPAADVRDLGGSVFSLIYAPSEAAYPRRPELAREVVASLRQAVRERTLYSLVAVGDGGAIVTLLKMWFRAPRGLGLEIAAQSCAVPVLFHEAPWTWLAVVKPERKETAMRLLEGCALAYQPLAKVVAGERIAMPGLEVRDRQEVLAWWRGRSGEETRDEQ
jgi:phosphoribosylformylglycinamidine synthase II